MGAKRSMLPHFQSHYEERFYALDAIVKNHKEATTFEDFATSVYSPASLQCLFATEGFSRPNSVASTSFSETDSSSQGMEYRPRARTDASAFSSSTITLESTETVPDSPKNLKKLTAAIRANINNNVARVNRPVNDSNHQQPSPPLSSSSKKR